VVVVVVVVVVVIVVVVGDSSSTFVTTFMQDIYNYIPETNHDPRVCRVAAVL